MSKHETPTTGPHTQEGAKAKGRWHHLMDPSVLFAIVTLVVLAILWSVTFNLIARERAAADRAAAALTVDVANTYEAQVVRALREIDQTLKLVRYDLRRQSPEETLQDLADRDLLPPALLFTVVVADANGDTLAANQDITAEERVSPDTRRRALQSASMVVGKPQQHPDGDETLYFARRFERENNRHGLVMLMVDASYFVSGYDPSALGERGVLGIVGTDGIFRARRSGDTVSVGEQIDYDSWVMDDLEGEAEVQLNRWDNTRRYTIAREMYQYPLAIVVGLSEREQMAGAAEARRVYLWRSAGASVLLIAILGLLGWLSWRLQKERSRVLEERIEHARRVEYLAFHDSLTELPNRAFFSRLLTQEMLQARRYQRSFALLFLDLDRFKTINDSLGHEAGDDLLKEIAARLNRSVRDSDIVARLGGDEFVVLLPEIRVSSEVAPVAEKILSAAARPFTLVGQEFRVTVSIGVTLFPKDGDDEQTLMKNADVAMYHAKEQGKNNFQFYSDELNTNSLERLSLESSLRNALEHDQFRLYYQAKRDMATSRVTGMEALLRWEHPELGIIFPMQFIPLAEENGLIIPIGRWVFRTACQQNVDWQKEGFPALSMAINLSARQFIDEHLLDDITLALEETGMDPRLLEVEITESMVMHDMQQTIKILESLKQMGVRVAIDDFGTGYSSLSHLKQFPVDTIKIDGSFIHDLVRSTENQGLTKAIIAVGRSLGLRVVAEGVETVGQYDCLRGYACDEFQGFYGNEPLPAEQFAQMVRQQEK